MGQLQNLVKPATSHSALPTTIRKRPERERERAFCVALWSIYRGMQNRARKRERKKDEARSSSYLRAHPFPRERADAAATQVASKNRPLGSCSRRFFPKFSLWSLLFLLARERWRERESEADRYPILCRLKAEVDYLDLERLPELHKFSGIIKVFDPHRSRKRERERSIILPTSFSFRTSFSK